MKLGSMPDVAPKTYYAETLEPSVSYTIHPTKYEYLRSGMEDKMKDMEYNLVTSMFNHYKSLCMRSFDPDYVRLFNLYLDRKIDLELERKDANR